MQLEDMNGREAILSQAREALSRNDSFQLFSMIQAILENINNKYLIRRSENNRISGVFDADILSQVSSSILKSTQLTRDNILNIHNPQKENIPNYELQVLTHKKGALSEKTQGIKNNNNSSKIEGQQLFLQNTKETKPFQDHHPSDHQTFDPTAVKNQQFHSNQPTDIPKLTQIVSSLPNTTTAPYSLAKPSSQPSSSLNSSSYLHGSKLTSQPQPQTQSQQQLKKQPQQIKQIPQQATSIVDISKTPQQQRTSICSINLLQEKQHSLKDSNTSCPLRRSLSQHFPTTGITATTIVQAPENSSISTNSLKSSSFIGLQTSNHFQFQTPLQANNNTTAAARIIPASSSNAIPSVSSNVSASSQPSSIPVAPTPTPFSSVSATHRQLVDSSAALTINNYLNSASTSTLKANQSLSATPDQQSSPKSVSPNQRVSRNYNINKSTKDQQANSILIQEPSLSQNQSTHQQQQQQQQEPSSQSTRILQKHRQSRSYLGEEPSLDLSSRALHSRTPSQHILRESNSSKCILIKPTQRNAETGNQPIQQQQLQMNQTLDATNAKATVIVSSKQLIRPKDSFFTHSIKNSHQSSSYVFQGKPNPTGNNAEKKNKIDQSVCFPSKHARYASYSMPLNYNSQNQQQQQQRDSSTSPLSSQNSKMLDNSYNISNKSAIYGNSINGDSTGAQIQRQTPNSFTNREGHSNLSNYNNIDSFGDSNIQNISQISGSSSLAQLNQTKYKQSQQFQSSLSLQSNIQITPPNQQQQPQKQLHPQSLNYNSENITTQHRNQVNLEKSKQNGLVLHYNSNNIGLHDASSSSSQDFLKIPSFSQQSSQFYEISKPTNNNNNTFNQQDNSSSLFPQSTAQPVNNNNTNSSSSSITNNFLFSDQLQKQQQHQLPQQICQSPQMIKKHSPYEFPQGDQEYQFTLHETASVASSCSLLVNNEYSAAYENTLDALQNLAPLADQHQLLTKYSNINLKIKDFSSKKSLLFAKDPPAPASNYIPSHIFEEFFITGPQNADLLGSLKGMNQIMEKPTLVDAKVLYHFNGSSLPSSSSQNSTAGSNLNNGISSRLSESNATSGSSHSGTSGYSSQSKIISEFTFPFGCQAKQLKMTNSFSSINEILFANNNSVEQGSNSSVSCFVLAFRQGSEIQTASSLSTSSSAQGQAFPAYYSRVLGLLEKVNPSKTLYCICFKAKDFVETTKLEERNARGGNAANYSSSTSQKELQKSYSTSNMQKSRMKFWQTEKVYTFVTYFPFVRFFLRVITNLLNLVKIKRIKSYNERLDSAPNTLANIDSDFFTQTFISIAEKTLYDLLQQDLPDLNSFLSINIESERIMARISGAADASRLETEWGVIKAVSQFDLNNLLFLFLSLLLEHSLVFVSKNITLLTSTLMMFQNALIRPLKWVHPMVFNLPEKLIPILGSPVPILVGINKDSSFIQKSKLDKEFPNCLFIHLGSVLSFSILNAQVVQDITLEIFNEIKEKVEPAFKKISSLSFEAASLQEHEEQRIKEDCFSFVDALSSYLSTEIFSKMPLQPIYSSIHPGILDYEAITEQTISAVGKHKQFLKTLFKTQMLTYYMEERYSSKVSQK